MNIKIISAGAGSGKTYRLTSEMVELLKSGKVRASGIIATTFTKKAAAELQERVRVRLLEEGLTKEADDLTNALIGTVHGLGVKLLKRFAFEAGVSPEVAIIADEDQQIMFNQSLSTVLTSDKVETVEKLCDRLGLHKKERYDWRKMVKQLTEVARANDFGKEVLEVSKVKSFAGFKAFLGEGEGKDAVAWLARAPNILKETIQLLNDNEDETKMTQTAIKDLKGLQNELRFRGDLHWYQWVKICKLKTGAKSRDEVLDLKEFAQQHVEMKAFHEDIKNFIYQIFDIALAAIDEYDNYKKRRGLIDYTDMEVLVKELLKNESIQEVLKEELDLLMVDEFQDTSPMQLEIFLKLSDFAKESVWVGDPKQSIYGFRGAEPKLMEAIIKKMGGVQPENVQTDSWRSREDVVYLTNALFCKAFNHLPESQVALVPKRRKIATEHSSNDKNEPSGMGHAIIHWHCTPDIEGKRMPGKPWMENAIAHSIKKTLERGTIIYPKEEKVYRTIRPGDIAVLCKTNRECQVMAEALHRAGIRAAISRSGLLSTAESKLILACLKFILDKYDSLSIAEILILAADISIEEIIENRLDYLAEKEIARPENKWGEQHDFILKLNELRAQVVELSSTEILNLLLEELDLRRIIVSWGNVEQRLSNVDVLRKLAVQYEEACNRLHSAASLGGFLLSLNNLQENDVDMQGSGESPDAVDVLTYHRSKGLEWPMVVCHAMEANLRSDVWGISLINEKADVDLDNVLSNRWLRFWVNPYADQIKGTQLLERIETSAAKADKLKDGLAEEARLLYVGITRARDYLVFPTRPATTKWLNRVANEGKESHPTLDADDFETPWSWKEKPIEKSNDHELFPVTFPSTNLAEEAVDYLEAATGQAIHTPYLIDLKKETVAGDFKVDSKGSFSYASPIDLEEDAEQPLIAQTMKAFLAADSTAYDFKDRLAMEVAFYRRFEIEDMLSEKAMLKASDAYSHWLTGHFEIKETHRKYPIRLLRKNRLFTTALDMVLETEEGLVLIQNSSFAGEGKALIKKAKELGDYLFLSQTALREIFGDGEIRTMVHFVLSGKLVEVGVKELQLSLF
ncbi:MAG: ATP-dependent helicase/nuclease subunit A [Saprospiraceae bacterium]|jgi:ATP-dependent helicase/nuclease subunit A